MNRYILISLLLIAAAPGEAARRRTVDANGNVLIERGRPRALARTVTEFNGTWRYGRAYGGGPRGFAASAIPSAPVDAPAAPSERD